MAWFTVETRYTEDRDKRLASRPRHREYLEDLVARGQVLAGGPYADETGGFSIYQVADAAELDRLLAADPYTVDDVAARRIVREWNITIGPLAGSQ